LDPGRRFVIADIPGLIEGAAEGAGLGIRFLKHLSRTGLLLHVVDLLPLEGDLVDQIRTVERELERFSDALAGRERWLVLNKADLLPPDEATELRDQVVEDLQWQGPVFVISSITGRGCDALLLAIMEYLEQQQELQAQAANRLTRADTLDAGEDLWGPDGGRPAQADPEQHEDDWDE